MIVSYDNIENQIVIGENCEYSVRINGKKNRKIDNYGIGKEIKVLVDYIDENNFGASSSWKERAWNGVIIRGWVKDYIELIETENNEALIEGLFIDIGYNRYFYGGLATIALLLVTGSGFLGWRWRRRKKG